MDLSEASGEAKKPVKLGQVVSSENRLLRRVHDSEFFPAKSSTDLRSSKITNCNFPLVLHWHLVQASWEVTSFLPFCSFCRRFALPLHDRESIWNLDPYDSLIRFPNDMVHGKVYSAFQS